jgi:hypothetical protein
MSAFHSESFAFLTVEDQAILTWLPNQYENAISDRNDGAIMTARTVLAATGCRATRDRVMPAEVAL